jgi:hypothetical protein
MIRNQRSFYIEAYTAKTYDDTSSLRVTFNAEESYLRNVNRIAVTKIFIPNTIWQYEPGDYIDLLEGLTTVKIKFDYMTFQDYQQMATFLGDILTKNSPNRFNYIATLNTNIKYQNSINILCSDTTTFKSISTYDSHVKAGFGLKEVNLFNGNTFNTDILDLTPIHILYINTDIIESNNTAENNNSSIIATYNLKTLGDQQPGDLLVSSKEYNGKKTANFYVTDYDNEVVPLNNANWYMEISLFQYDESIVDLLSNFIKSIILRNTIKDNKKILKENKNNNEEDDDDEL